MHGVIDGDILVHRLGFAAQNDLYRAIHLPSTDCVTYKTQAHICNLILFYCQLNKIELDWDEWDIHKIALVKEHFNIGQVCNLVIKNLVNLFNLDSYEIVLTDSRLKKNFRYEIDKTYKQNRKGQDKPLMYKYIRKYFIKHHDAKLVSGIEADDYLGYSLSNKNNISISVDKDIAMVPGKHGHIDTGLVVEVEDPGTLELEVKTDRSGKKNKKLRGTGFKWFCAQMLMGDIGDGIKGLNGIGDVYAYENLKDLHTEKELWDKVVKLYKEKKDDRLMQVAGLLWILRDKDKNFNDFLQEKLS